jgi:hypothetical protein
MPWPMPPSVSPASPLAQTQTVPSPARPAQPAAPAPASIRAPAALGPGLQGFSIVLVLGSTQGGGVSSDIPAAAGRALGDMKDFLPYKSYRLLDAAWILGGGPGQSVQSLLQGPEGRQYEVSLKRAPVSPVVNLTFVLRDAAAGPAVSGSTDLSLRWQQNSTELRVLQDRIVANERELERARTRLGADHPDVRSKEADVASMRRQAGELQTGQRALSGADGIISTSFTMDVGETVVVGTSRVGGDTALIALLTAVPRGGR